MLSSSFCTIACRDVDAWLEPPLLLGPEGLVAKEDVKGVDDVGVEDERSCGWGCPLLLS
jgi:hypothetical protein